MNKSTRYLITVVSLVLMLAAAFSTGAAAPNPFIGVWESTDTDGSHQILTIGGGPMGSHHFRYYDYGASVCGLGPGGEFLFAASARGVLTEDTQDGYAILHGVTQVYCQTAPPSPAPVPSPSQFAYTYDPIFDTLTDIWGVEWTRL